MWIMIDASRPDKAKIFDRIAVILTTFNDILMLRRHQGCNWQKIASRFSTFQYDVTNASNKRFDDIFHTVQLLLGAQSADEHNRWQISRHTIIRVMIQPFQVDFFLTLINFGNETSAMNINSNLQFTTMSHLVHWSKDEMWQITTTIYQLTTTLCHSSRLRPSPTMTEVECLPKTCTTFNWPFSTIT